MELISTPIDGLFVIRPRVFEDPRGYFFESFSHEGLKRSGLDINVCQTNVSCSQAGVVRGLHFQVPPHAQGKLVRVLRGAVLDVVVDIRKGSTTYGMHFAQELSEANKLSMWVPPGFAHGFKTLADDTLFYYYCTGYYNREAEGGIRWNDPALGIDWGISDPILSDKDAVAPLLRDLRSPF